MVYLLLRSVSITAKPFIDGEWCIYLISRCWLLYFRNNSYWYFQGQGSHQSPTYVRFFWPRAGSCNWLVTIAIVAGRVVQPIHKIRSHNNHKTPPIVFSFPHYHARFFVSLVMIPLEAECDQFLPVTTGFHPVPNQLSSVLEGWWCLISGITQINGSF